MAEYSYTNNTNYIPNPQEQAPYYHASGASVRSKSPSQLRIQTNTPPYAQNNRNSANSLAYSTDGSTAVSMNPSVRMQQQRLAQLQQMAAQYEGSKPNSPHHSASVRAPPQAQRLASPSYQRSTSPHILRNRSTSPHMLRTQRSSSPHYQRANSPHYQRPVPAAQYQQAVPMQQPRAISPHYGRSINSPNYNSAYAVSQDSYMRYNYVR